MASESVVADADAPAHLTRYLLNAERVVVAVRRHPAQVLEPVASAIGGLVVVIWLQLRISPDLGLLSDVLWVAWLVVLGRAVVRLWLWRVDWFVATDTRLMLTYGIVTRKVAMMPLFKVTDMSYNRSPVGRVLGYGQFVLESAGHDQAMHVVSWLPNPDALYKLICGEIFDPRKLGRGGGARRPGPPGWQDPRGATLRPRDEHDEVVDDPDPRPPSRWPGPPMGRPHSQPTIDISDD